MTTEENIDRQTTVVESLASAHASRIEGRQATKNEDFDRPLASLLEATANLERQLQAYINTLPRH